MVTRTADEVRPGVSKACPLVTWRLPGTAKAAPSARLLVRGALGALGLTGEAVFDGELMVSELATNALRHAEGPYALRLLSLVDVVFCEVLDGSAQPSPWSFARLTPSQATSAATGDQAADLAECGRGLALVRQLSGGRCGSRPLADERGAYAKGVWFGLPGPG